MNFLVLGSGLVSRPLIRYLLDQPGFQVTTASLMLERAEEIIDGHKQGTALYHDVTDSAATEKLIQASDIVISLLPYVFHVDVAKLCIRHRKHLITTSYVSAKMKELHAEAEAAGVLLLNECGLDPGIDHMSAMRVIHGARKRGGKVISFRSSTGALPALEANNNPFGYKFSWSPRGVLLASRNPARWLEDGKEVKIDGPDLFANYRIHDIPAIGTFEDYPNRDSIPYRDAYGLEYAQTVYRGTLRLMGWCETLKAIADLGWLDESPLRNGCKTYGELTKLLIKADKDIDLAHAVSDHTGLKQSASAYKRMEWLGLFGDTPLPREVESPLDCLHELTSKKLTLPIHERDMIVMHHEFTIQYEDRQELITSTLVEHGVPHEDTAVARTVAYPAAIAARMLAEGKIQLTGCRIPVHAEIYNPILDELENDIGIRFDERIVAA